MFPEKKTTFMGLRRGIEGCLRAFFTSEPPDLKTAPHADLEQLVIVFRSRWTGPSKNVSETQPQTHSLLVSIGNMQWSVSHNIMNIWYGTGPHCLNRSEQAQKEHLEQNLHKILWKFRNSEIFFMSHQRISFICHGFLHCRPCIGLLRSCCSNKAQTSVSNGGQYKHVSSQELVNPKDQIYFL